MKKVLKGVPTYLPVFSGFYGSFYFEDTTYLADEETGVEPEIEYQKAFLEMSKVITSKISEKLLELGYITKDIEFESLVSPKENNISNDVINCTVYPLVSKIKETIKNHIQEFQTYIEENFTSCSGFYSSYPNTVDYWLKVVNHKSLRENPLYLGILLDFCLVTIEGYTDNELYNDVCCKECEILCSNIIICE